MYTIEKSSPRGKTPVPVNWDYAAQDGDRNRAPTATEDFDDSWHDFLPKRGFSLIALRLLRCTRSCCTQRIPMKPGFVLALSLLMPLCTHAAVAPVAILPVASGALLSTNLSAAVVRLDKAMQTNTGGTFGGIRIRPLICPGGNCGTAPITALPGCTDSPENPTFLLGILGMAGLLLGRYSYSRRRVAVYAA